MLLAVMLVGGYFRLAGLADCSLHMDNQDFLTPCREGLTFSQVFSRWQELPTGKNHLPFPVAVTTWVLQTFGLPLTFGTLILPSALWGVLAIGVAFAAGRALRGPGFGLLFATVVALNPICIQISRLAYYYSPAMLGCFLALWSVALFFQVLRWGTIPRAFHAVGPLSALMMFYSDASVWPFAFLVTGTIFAYAAWQFVRRRRFGRDLAIMGFTYGLVALPLISAPWGLVSVLKGTVSLSPEAGAYWKEVFWSVGSPWPLIGPALLSYAWGTTAIRAAFSILVLVMGVAYVFLATRHDRRYAIMLGLAVVALLATVVALTRTVAGFSHARIAALAPIYLLLLSLGLAFPACRFRQGPGWQPGRLVPAACIAAAVLMALWPAWLCTRQTGRPAPYRALVAWLDAHLPADTPVLTERFFDAYNEFRVHPPTNVVFMSTVRNQIAPEYLGNRFRDRSESFLRENPVSAMHQSRLLWDHPQVGPWTWPGQFYARTMSLTNEAGLALHRMGLNDQTIPGNREQELAYIRTVLYNLPEDVVARARQEGRPCVGFFGPGWKYTKTQDYRDWRVLGESAAIEAHNLTTNVLECELVIHGVSVNGDKHVVFSLGGKQRFENMKLGDVVCGPLRLAPGYTRIEARDPYWATRQVPLLVERIVCRPVDEGRLTVDGGR